MGFEKGNKVGFKKRVEYSGEAGAPPADTEEVTVPFVSQYPEGRGEVTEGSDEPGPVPTYDKDAVDPSLDEPTVALMYHGTMKGGQRIFQRPIPQTNKGVDPADVVLIGKDRIGMFTPREAEYLLMRCKGAFTKVEK